MGDVIEGIQVEQPGQVVNPDQGNSTGSTQKVEPQQDADLKAAGEAIRRQQQSETDKTAAVLAKGIKKLKESGINVTAEQVLQMFSGDLTKIQAMVTEPTAQPVQYPAQAPIEQGQPHPDPVVRKAQEILKDVPQDSPEWELIDKVTDDPELFLSSVRSAATKFAERTQNLSNPARIPTLAGGDGSHTPTVDPNRPGVDILDDYYKRNPLK